MDLDQCGCIIMWVVKLKINQGEGFLHCFSNLFRLLLFLCGIRWNVLRLRMNKKKVNIIRERVRNCIESLKKGGEKTEFFIT